MSFARPTPTVRPELVEGLFFFTSAKEKQGFDKLSPNGVGEIHWKLHDQP